MDKKYKELMMKFSEIKTISFQDGDVAIAPMHDGLEDLFFSIFNDNEVLEFMGDWGLNPKSMSYIKDYIKAHRDDTWIICKKIDSCWVAIGYCGIYLRERHKVGILRIAIEKTYRGKGGVLKAYSMLINHGFKTLSFNTLHASMVSNNQKSIHLHKKIGFDVCGRYKKSRIDLNSNIHDEVLMELTKEKYEAKNNLQ